MTRFSTLIRLSKLVPLLPVVIVLAAATTACGGTTPPKAESAAARSDAPCAPSDCPPCDLTKSKCTGPMVCDDHPERMKSLCVRNAAGTCSAENVCESPLNEGGATTTPPDSDADEAAPPPSGS